MIYLILLILVYITNAQRQQQNTVIAQTTYGTVQGKKVDYGNDQSQLYYGQSEVFLGIPYAQPPVGDLRFQAPQPVTSYPRNYNATYFRPKCPQANPGQSNTSEDCLYLNVFTQQSGNASAQAAVMVFIDGGDGLSSGGQDESQMKGTVRNLVSRGVVVVTMQYRLGALGFFTTYTEQFPANVGMLDQVAALQWTQTQISNFGGDPNKITLAGQGDGACAVDAHTLSPLSQNLFQQAIIQSGTINSCYSNSPAIPANANIMQQTTSMPVLQYDQGIPYSPFTPNNNNNNNNNNNVNPGQNNFNNGQSQNPPIVTSNSNFQNQPQNFNQNPNQQGLNQNQPNYNQNQGQNFNPNNQNQGAGFNQNQPNYNQNQGPNSNTNFYQSPVFTSQGQGAPPQNMQGNYQQQQQGQNFNQNQQPNYNGVQNTNPGFTPNYDPSNNQGANYNQMNNQGQLMGAQSDDPSQQLAAQLCNISPYQWSTGQLGDLSNCMYNYTFDVFVQTQGDQTATWMIVRDNNFLPDSIENLQARRPPIPIIIGTVQDEDADYAFKLIANGDANQPEGQMFNNWMVDFARKNKVNQTTQNQISNVIAQNYNITPAVQNNNQFPTSTPSNYQQYDAIGRAGYSNQYPGQYLVQNGNSNNQIGNAGLNQNPNGNQNFGNQNSNQIPNGNFNNNNNFGNQNQNQNSNGNPNNFGQQNQNMGATQGSFYSGNQQQFNNNQQPPQGNYGNQNGNFGNQPQFDNNGNFNGNQNGNGNMNGNYPAGQLVGNANQGAQYDPNGNSQLSVTNPQQIQSLRTISQISSDSGVVSQTATEIDSFMQNGNQMVRVYQFTHVTDLGRDSVPQTGSWKPVYKGQDQLFLFMSETVWTNGNPTSADRQAADEMGNRWTQFAKTGQITNWGPSNSQTYTYCNINSTPQISNGYAQQARTVFNDQVNQIVQQAQQTAPPPQQIQQQPFYPPPQQQQQQFPPQQNNRLQQSQPAQIQYSSNGGGNSNFHISFSLQNYSLPFN